MLCPSTASLGFDNMHIKGSGTISADHTSIDIHLEITNVNDSQPSAPSAPAPSTPASVQSIEKAMGPYTAKYQQDLPFFGVETGKCIYIYIYICAGLVGILDELQDQNGRKDRGECRASK